MHGDNELFSMMAGGRYRREDEELFDMIGKRKKNRFSTPSASQARQLPLPGGAFGVEEPRETVRYRKRETVLVDVFGHTCLMPVENYYRRIKRAKDIVRMTPGAVAVICAGVLVIFHGAGSPGMWLTGFIAGMVPYILRVPKEVTG